MPESTGKNMLLCNLFIMILHSGAVITMPLMM